MQLDIFNYDLSNTDLNMYNCGMEDCTPGHYYGPAVRDYYLIHYIYSGRGFFRHGNTTYYLEKGQGFLISPFETTYYQADSKDPWHYCWVGFSGKKALFYLLQANLSSDNPIFTYRSDDYLKNCILSMIDSDKSPIGRETKQLGHLYLFLTRIIESALPIKTSVSDDTRKNIYTKKVVEYIAKNYSRKITISEICTNIGLDRSYMGSIFKDCLNTSIQQFLLDYRIGKACSLMTNTTLTIGDISRSVGYDDPLLFSKMFKKCMSKSPKEYRKSILQPY
jgi:AraC-like DNA-binding protein